VREASESAAGPQQLFAEGKPAGKVSPGWTRHPGRCCLRIHCRCRPAHAIKPAAEGWQAFSYLCYYDCGLIPENEFSALMAAWKPIQWKTILRSTLHEDRRR